MGRQGGLESGKEKKGEGFWTYTRRENSWRRQGTEMPLLPPWGTLAWEKKKEYEKWYYGRDQGGAEGGNLFLR